MQHSLSSCVVPLIRAFPFKQGLSLSFALNQIPVSCACSKLLTSYISIISLVNIYYFIPELVVGFKQKLRKFVERNTALPACLSDVY